MAELDIAVIEDWDLLEGIRDEWDRLAERLPSCTWYQTAEATLALAARTDPFLKPAVVVARDATGAIKGVLPLGIRTTTGVRQKRTLVPLAEWHGSYFDAVAESQEVAASLWSLGLSAIAGWDFGDLRHVPEDGMLRRLNPEVWIRSGDRKYLRFDPETGHRTRAKFLRNLHRLENIGGVEFQLNTPPAEMAMVSEKFVELHTRRWMGYGPAAEFDSAAGKLRLNSVLTSSSNRNAARVGSIAIAGELVAAYIAIRWRDSHYAWRMAHAKQWDKYSVGMVLFDLMLQSAAAEGCTTAELGRGDEVYKDRWSPVSMPLWRRVAYGPTLAGRIGNAKANLKRLLVGSHEAAP